MENDKLKVAIYCRLSEEDRNKQNASDDSNSIQNQKTMLLQHAIEKGWEVFRIYSDDDYTGADRRRPQFNQLLLDAQAHKFDIVLCKNQSRFTRELELVEKYIHGLFPIWGIRFIGLVDNADTDNRGNKKSRQINGLVNEWYLEDMSDNIRRTLTSRRQNGHHIGAFALYGYRKDPNTKGHLLIDEEAAKVVREVFSLYAQGFGKTAIARILNERGIPNPTEYKRIKGLRYQNSRSQTSTLWKYCTISGMLTNEIYIGNMVQGKYGSVSYKTKQCKPRPRENWIVVTGTHDPIIHSALWEQVQNRIAQNAKPFSTGMIGLFAGKVRCGYCNCILRSSKNRGKYYLQCQTRHISKDSCVGTFAPVAELEQTILAELHRLSDTYLDRNQLKSIRFNVDLQKRSDTISGQLTVSQKRIDACSSSIRQLYMDKARGIISEADFLELSDAFSKERAYLTEHAAILQNQLHTLDERAQTASDPDAILEKYIHPEHLSREMVDTFIDHIIIYRRDPESKTIPTEIHWQF